MRDRVGQVWEVGDWCLLVFVKSSRLQDTSSTIHTGLILDAIYEEPTMNWVEDDDNDFTEFEMRDTWRRMA